MTVQKGAESGIIIIPASFENSPEGAHLILDAEVAGDVAVAGDFAYIPAYSDGFFVVDVSDKENPREVAQMETRGLARYAEVEGGFLYLTDGNLLVYDLSDPADPELICNYDTPTLAGQVLVADGYTFLILSESLLILDISNPAEPAEVGYFNPYGSPVDITVISPYLYVAETSLLSVFDCSEALEVLPELEGRPPITFLLDPAYPNPFNSRTNVRFNLPRSGRIALDIFDCQGTEN